MLHSFKARKSLVGIFSIVSILVYYMDFFLLWWLGWLCYVVGVILATHIVVYYYHLLCIISLIKVSQMNRKKYMKTILVIISLYLGYIEVIID